MVHQPDKEEAVSECDLQAIPPHPSFDPSEIKLHTDDLCSGLSSETADTGTDGVGVETCPTAILSDLWDLREPDPSDAEDQKYNSQTNVCLLLVL